MSEQIDLLVKMRSDGYLIIFRKFFLSILFSPNHQKHRSYISFFSTNKFQKNSHLQRLFGTSCCIQTFRVALHCLSSKKFLEGHEFHYLGEMNIQIVISLFYLNCKLFLTSHKQ